jgi:phosphinothricin acetyltransferase
MHSGLNMPPTIRLATTADASQVLAIYAPFCTATAVSFEETPPSEDEMRQRIITTLERFPWLVAEHEGAILGFVYARPYRERAAYRWTTESTAYIRDGYRGRGLGRALYTSLFAILKLQGLCTVIAGITLPNAASVGLHEALGFRPAGVTCAVGYKQGAWHDVGWWQLSLRDLPVLPVEPRSLPLVAGANGWEAALAAGLSLLRE